MNEQANKLQAVINTLEGLEIKAKKDTMMQLLGCMQVLSEVRDALNAPVEIEMEVPEDGRNDHAE